MYAKLLKKNQILDAGLDCFYNQGYNGTGVKDIVDAAGVPKGSFYNYFDSKESFAVEALGRLANQALDELREKLLVGEELASTRIFKFLSSKIDLAMEQEFFGGCLVGNICQEMSESCEPIRDKVCELMAQHVGVFAEAISMGQQDGSVNPNLDAMEVAEFLFGAWEGALLKMKADRSRRPFDICLKHAEILLKP